MCPVKYLYDYIVINTGNKRLFFTGIRVYGYIFCGEDGYK